MHESTSVFDSALKQGEKQSTKVMPQTLLSISIVSIKVLNNIMRIDLKFAQNLLVKNEILAD